MKPIENLSDTEKITLSRVAKIGRLEGGPHDGKEFRRQWDSETRVEAGELYRVNRLRVEWIGAGTVVVYDHAGKASQKESA